jgi:TPR repeat protein
MAVDISNHPGNLDDLALESLFLLRERPRGSADHMVETARTSKWRERSALEEENWLRASAEAGDVFAMEKLGEKLLKNSLPEEGQRWLARAAEIGSPFAMYHLGEWLLDESGFSFPKNQGERWLRAAATAGYACAAVSLGARLLTGDGVTAQPAEGEKILREKASQGSVLAIVLLGLRLLSGRDLTQSEEEGSRWLQAIAGRKLEDLSTYGLYIYDRGLSAPTARRKRWLVGEAAWLFLEALRRGDASAGTNLAYLVRRGEVDPKPFPAFDELLNAALKARMPFAVVNQALQLAAGFACQMDWQTADAQFASAAGAPSVREWWQRQAQDGDPEGHLVLAWSAFHTALPDPDKLSQEHRITIARKGGWSVPDWLLQNKQGNEN